jgi:hypothetical protein
MAAEPIEPEDVWAMALGSLVPGLGLLATPFCVLIAIMCFDTGEGYWPWVGAIFMMSLPLLSLVSLIGGWTLLGLKRLAAAQTMLLAGPLAWIAVLVVLWLAPHFPPAVR